MDLLLSRYAAHCRATLGQNTAALDRFRRLLDDVATAESHAGELALDIRYSIGMLLAAGDKAAAENVFESLHQDHLLIDGPDDERTREIADLLTRIRLPTSPDTSQVSPSGFRPVSTWRSVASSFVSCAAVVLRPDG